MARPLSSPPKLDKSRFLRGSVLAQQPERDLLWALDTLSRGQSLTRRMSQLERLCLTVTDARPTHLLTVHSPDLSRVEAARAWRRFIRRVNRRKSGSKPVVYLATLARSSRGGGGYHLHALLWGYLHAPVAHGAARGVGFGKPHIDRVPDGRADRPGAARMVSYVLGQTEPVFGTTDHRRHRPREKSGRRLIYPQKRTLAAHGPKLLSALDLAQDRSVSDKELVRRLPMFSSSTARGILTGGAP